MNVCYKPIHIMNYFKPGSVIFNHLSLWEISKNILPVFPLAQNDDIFPGSQTFAGI